MHAEEMLLHYHCNFYAANNKKKTKFINAACMFICRKMSKYHMLYFYIIFNSRVFNLHKLTKDSAKVSISRPLAVKRNSPVYLV